MGQKSSGSDHRHSDDRPSWQFSKRRPSHRARPSQVEKFFRSDAIDDQASAVIREGIQNSLDAAVVEDETGTKSINILISIGEVKSKKLAHFIPKLFQHLDAIRDKLPEVPTPDEPIRFLAFEDFNTTGLQGDPEEWDPPEDSKNTFFNFFRGEGVTNKSGNQRGRHGVGKLVFSIASRAKTIFGLTATNHSSPMLMGTSTLPLHKIGATSYDPDGWFGVAKVLANDDFTVPVRDEGLISEFTTAFGLDRESLPGLSIVVPWLTPSIDHNSIVSSVLRQFFWPILQKRLFVDVKSQDGGTVRISAETLPGLVAQLRTEGADDGLKEFFDLALWANSLDPEDVRSTETPSPGAQNWDAQLVPEELRQHLREELSHGRSVAIRLPILIRKKGQKEGEPSDFHIYLRPDPDAKEGNVLFIRKGLLISGVKCRRITGYRALVVIDEGPLGEFLGDAENPSHTEWQKETVKNDYSFYDSYLKFVVQSVPNLLKSLHDEQRTADAEVLLDLFSLPVDDPQQPARKGGRKRPKPGSDSATTDFEKIKFLPKRYSLHKHSSGFVIRAGDAEAQLPKTIDVDLAYGVRRGNPFRKYRPADFDLKSRAIAVDVTGGRVVQKQNNHLRVEIQSADFEIAVTGFDTNRDLYIDPKVDRAEEGDNGQED